MGSLVARDHVPHLVPLKRESIDYVGELVIWNGQPPFTEALTDALPHLITVFQRVVSPV